MKENKETTACLYHYTSVDAFLGMLKDFSTENKNLKMWATNVLFLNDPSEYEYGKYICQFMLQEIEDELKVEESKQIVNLMQNNFFAMWELASSHIPTDLNDSIPYVISFSKEADSLPMWNSYGKNGNGIAIGFNKSKLVKFKKSFGQDSPNDFTLRNCLYDLSLKEFAAIKEKIKIQYEKMQEMTEKSNSHEIFAQQVEIIRLLKCQVAPFIKHIGYKYEREVRCKVYKAKQILCRAAKGMAVPYVEVEIPIDCIERIIIGPTLDAERMYFAVSTLLHSKNIDTDIKIEVSTIPYRG